MARIKISSAKQKGRLFQNRVREDILKTFPTLHPDDVRTASGGQQGRDILLSEAAQKVFPYAVECKHQEAVSIWSWWLQAVTNAGCLKPCLIFKRNRSEDLVVIRLTDFLDLTKGDSDVIQK